MPRRKKDLTILPVLPLRGMMIFPYMIAHFDVGREKSIAALEDGFAGDQRIFFVAQIDENEASPTSKDCHSVGTIALVKQVLKMPDNTLRVLAEGLERARIHTVLQEDPYLKAELVPLKDNARADGSELSALVRCTHKYLQDYAQESGRFPQETVQSMCAVEAPAQLADVIAANVLTRMDDRQKILETEDVGDRLEILCGILQREKEVATVEKAIQARVRGQIDKHQRDAYLREQLHAIRVELGEQEDLQTTSVLRERLDALPLPEEAREKAMREITRLQRMGADGPEANIARTYLEWMMELPWGVYAEERLDIPAARKIFDEDHYGLTDIKQRLIEYLAVRKMKDDMKGPILCLVGPPGVGKTSIARSVARALGRSFAQMSLGGVRDEAEIRGHRRTYIGAIPGRVISALRYAKEANPVFLLDEIDKLSSSFQGDPAAALLEVLDPEQNKGFRDHYLEVPFDLSKVLFLTTANTTETIPRPLLDRMEVIEVSGYTSQEKLAIARQHLLPKQREQHGLTGKQLRVTDAAIEDIIELYTREAGVRNLERAIGTLCRKTACALLEGDKKSITVKPQSLEEMLGLPRYREDQFVKTPLCGVVNGLAYTPYGGTTLQVECAVLPGTGGLELTGQLGDVMKESARAAMSFVRSHAKALGIAEDFHRNHDLHVHVPEGAVPKDGPSAGVTLTCAIVSALSGRMARQDVAMTGEITLRGRVLPIGGVKEKLLAAYRAGMTLVLLPEENKRDLKDLPEQVLSKLEIRTMKTVEDAIQGVLL